MRLPVNPANDPPETNLPTPGDSSTPISQQQANSHPNSSTPLTSVDNPEFSNPDGPPSEVLPYHPTYLPKKVYFDSGQVPITRIPSSLMEQRNLLLRWIQFSLLETIASLSLGAVRRGIAKTSLGLNGLLIIIACYGLYASMSFRVLHIAIHAITLTSVCLLFMGYILLIALLGDESWWLLFVLFGFVSFDFFTGYLAIKFTKALIRFDKEIPTRPELVEPWTAPGEEVQHSWWTGEVINADEETGATEGLTGGVGSGGSGGGGGGGANSRNNNNSRSVKVSDRTFQKNAVNDRKKEIGNLDLADAPQEFLCPISLTVMADPVVAQDGHTYEKENIIKWFKSKRTSPVTRSKIKTDIIPNQALKSQILSYLEKIRCRRDSSTISLDGVEVSASTLSRSNASL